MSESDNDLGNTDTPQIKIDEGRPKNGNLETNNDAYRRAAIEEQARELAIRVINAARGGAPDPRTGVPKGSLAIALMVAQNATDDVLAEAIKQAAAPEWRMSSEWVGELSREGKVLALAWLAHTFHQGYVRGKTE